MDCAKELWKRIHHRIRAAIVALLIAAFLVTTFTLFREYFRNTFFDNILVEAYGMLFDILVIAIFIVWLDLRGEKGREKERYLEEIDDYRYWKEPEATYRLSGLIKRLNRDHQYTTINLADCYLLGAPLQKVNLRGACLDRAQLEGADLRGAILQDANLEDAILNKVYAPGANFNGAFLYGAWIENAILNKSVLDGADLEGAKLSGTRLADASLKKANLTLSDLGNTSLRNADLDGALLESANLAGARVTKEQLIKAKSLFGATIDSDLKKAIKQTHKGLLEHPPTKE